MFQKRMAYGFGLLCYLKALLALKFNTSSIHFSDLLTNH